MLPSVNPPIAVPPPALYTTASPLARSPPPACFSAEGSVITLLATTPEVVGSKLTLVELSTKIACSVPLALVLSSVITLVGDASMESALLPSSWMWPGEMTIA